MKINSINRFFLKKTYFFYFLATFERMNKKECEIQKYDMEEIARTSKEP